MDSNVGTTAPKTIEERQIKSETNKLADSMGVLSEKISILLQRLIPALRKETPPVKEDGKQVEVVLVEIANNIRQVRYLVEQNVSELNDIIDRLET